MEVIYGGEGEAVTGRGCGGGASHPGRLSPSCVHLVKTHEAPHWLDMHSPVVCHASMKTFT